jgi:osmoprotectant transport system permease protein
MDERIQSALALLPDYLARHVLLSACALALGLVLGLQLGLWVVRYPRLRWPTLAAAAFVQTIPGLALLALFYPLLLGLSTFTEKLLVSGCRRSASCPRCSRSRSIPCCPFSGTRSPA